MADQVGIINMALSKIGDFYISSVAETTKQCTYALIHWDTARDALIESYPWNFAIRKTALAWAGTTPSAGYTYEWTLPTDYSKAMYVTPTSDVDADDSMDFRVEEGKVRTNDSPAYLQYIAGVSTPSSWPASFCQLLACDLAVLLSEPLGGMSETAKQQLQVDRERALQQAQINDFNEGSDAAIGYYATIGCRE